MSEVNESEVTVTIKTAGRIQVNGEYLLGAFVEFPDGPPPWTCGMVWNRNFAMRPTTAKAGIKLDQGGK